MNWTLIQHWAKGTRGIIGCARARFFREVTAWNRHCWVFAQPANDWMRLTFSEAFDTTASLLGNKQFVLFEEWTLYYGTFCRNVNTLQCPHFSLVLKTEGIGKFILCFFFGRVLVKNIINLHLHRAFLFPCHTLSQSVWRVYQMCKCNFPFLSMT